MSFRRAMGCIALTCTITLAVPSVVRGEDGFQSHPQTRLCNRPRVSASSVNQLDSASSAMVAQQQIDRGHNSRDSRPGYTWNHNWWYWYWYWFWRWHYEHCVPDPPADVPEAPQVLMLSGSAALTGGAAILIIRRRTKNSAAVGV